MTKCELIIYWSSDDQAFIAEVPELPGCAADGTTRQTALKHVGVVIREWIETAKELGRPIPQPRGRLAFAKTAMLRYGINDIRRFYENDLRFLRRF